MSQVVKRTLQPVWREDWDAVVEEAMDQTLDLDMWDKDHVGANEFMGRATIPLSKLTDNGKSDQWVRSRKWSLKSTSCPPRWLWKGRWLQEKWLQGRCGSSPFGCLLSLEEREHARCSRF